MAAAAVAAGRTGLVQGNSIPKLFSLWHPSGHSSRVQSVLLAIMSQVWDQFDDHLKQLLQSAQISEEIAKKLADNGWNVYSKFCKAATSTDDFAEWVVELDLDGLADVDRVQHELPLRHYAHRSIQKSQLAGWGAAPSDGGALFPVYGHVAERCVVCDREIIVARRH